jgi:hypothetical protein
MKNEVVAGLSKVQLAALAARATSGFTRSQLAALAPDQVAAFTPAQMARLRVYSWASTL